MAPCCESRASTNSAIPASGEIISYSSVARQGKKRQAGGRRFVAFDLATVVLTDSDNGWWLDSASRLGSPHKPLSLR